MYALFSGAQKNQYKSLESLCQSYTCILQIFCLDSSCFVKNMAYGGYQLAKRKPVGDEFKCQEICQKTLGCVWFVYRSSTWPDQNMRKVCLLKFRIAEAPTYNGGNGLIAGPPYCDCE